MSKRMISSEVEKLPDALDRVEGQSRFDPPIKGLLSTYQSLLLQMLCQELRNPINTIISQSDGLRSEAAGAGENVRVIQGLRTITSNGRELLRLLNNTVDTMTLAGGNFILSDRPMDVESLIWECVYQIQSARMDFAGELKQQTVPGLPMLRLDVPLASRMLVALLSAALRLSRKGDLLTVEAHPVRDGGMEITLSGTRLKRDEEQHEIPAVITEDAPPLFQQRDEDSPALVIHFARAVMRAHDGAFLIEEHENSSTVIFRFPPERVENDLSYDANRLSSLPSRSSA